MAMSVLFINLLFYQVVNLKESVINLLKLWYIIVFY